MSAEQNKAIARRIPYEIFNERNLAVADEIVAVDFVNRSNLPGLPQGRENVKQLAGLLCAAFPDFQYTIEDEIAEGDKVVHRVTARGTHKGEFMGIPPTGKQATWTEIHIVRCADGKCVEHWANVDQLGLLQQLGVIPAPGQHGS